MLFALLHIACAPPEDTGDSAPEEDTEIPEQPVCEPAVVEYDGPDEPRVGDAWSFWLTCDGVLQMGASRLSVEPATAGSIDDSGSAPVITWNEAGDALLKVQTGRFKGEREVVVLP